MKTLFLHLLFALCIIIVAGCGAPTLLETPKIEKGFSIKAKLSASLVKEVDDSYSGDPWVVPQWAFILCPAWGSGSDIEIGMNLGIASRFKKGWAGEIDGIVVVPTVIEANIKYRLGNTTAIVVALPMSPLIVIPGGIRAYLVKSYLISSRTVYGSLFIDSKIGSASDFTIGNGSPDPRPSIGYGILLGIAPIKKTPHRMIAEIGFGMYRARYDNAWTGPIETRIHPFVGVGLGF